MEQTLGWIVRYYSKENTPVDQEHAKDMQKEELCVEYAMPRKNPYGSLREMVQRQSEHYMKTDFEGYLETATKYIETVSSTYSAEEESWKNQKLYADIKLGSPIVKDNAAAARKIYQLNAA